MELHQLQYFIAVAENHSFSKAANTIHIAQSSLSHQIIKLEKEIGTQLFQRNSKDVILTDAGKELYKYACRITNEINQVYHAMQKYVSHEAGHIAIGSLPLMGYLGITRLIASFHKSYPGIELELKEAGSSILIERLLNDEIDVAFFTPPAQKQYNQLLITPLIEDNLVVVVSNNHAVFDNMPIIDLKDLKDEKFIFMGPDNGMHSLCFSACQTAGFIPRVICESNQIDTIIGLVTEGLGVTLFTSRTANSLRHYNISIIPLLNPIIRTTALGIVKTNVNSLVENFCRFVLNNKNLINTKKLIF